jgi:hypothetical protein
VLPIQHLSVKVEVLEEGWGKGTRQANLPKAPEHLGGLWSQEGFLRRG